MNIEQIKADREAGTQGLWRIKKSPFEVYNVDLGRLDCEISAGFTLLAALYTGINDPDARRIARVPELEDALIEAVELLRDVLDEVSSNLDGYYAPYENVELAEKFLERFK